MRKIVKIVGAVSCTLAIMITNNFSVSAHDLKQWANYYPGEKANSTNSFGIIKSLHINGRVANYKWGNSTVKSYFGTALQASSNFWGGMIDVVESPNTSAFTVKYNPNMASTIAAYVPVYESSSTLNHLSIQNQTEMVIGNITSYSQIEKTQVLAHELGHMWGIDDLYGHNENLESIFSNTYKFNCSTRHDINAMYIGQGRPWYIDAGNNMKFLKKPGQFASNEWVYSIGNSPGDTNIGRYYLGNNGVYIPNACSKYNASYHAFSIGSTLGKGETLLENQYLSSSNKKYIAKMQSDGNFVVYNTDKVLWNSKTNGKGTGTKSITVQTDGNIVICDSTRKVLWNLWSSSSVNKRKAVRLVMQNDGNLVAYDEKGNSIWAISPKSAGVGNFNVMNVNSKGSCTNITSDSVNIGSVLNSGKRLSANQYLSSPNKKYIAKMQSDGNFVIYNTDGYLWLTGTNTKGTGTKSIIVQSDGNVVMYDASGKAVWNLWQYAGVNGKKITKLALQDDGNFVAYSEDGPVWWASTKGAYGTGTFN